MTLNGLRTPYTSEMTDSFAMTTFNLIGDRYYYFIDQIAGGLALNSKCNYPCADCTVAEPSICLACFPESPDISNGRPFL